MKELIVSLQEFERIYTKWNYETNFPTVPIFARKPKKYKLSKSKEVQTKRVELEADEHGRITEHIIVPKVSKQVTNTNAVTDLIVDYFHCIFDSKSIRRISSEGKWRPGMGFIKSSNKGMSDVEGIILGKYWSIEVKVGKDQQRESQRQRQIEVEHDGGIYWLLKWRDFETFQLELYEIIKKYNLDVSLF